MYHISGQLNSYNAKVNNDILLCLVQESLQRASCRLDNFLCDRFVTHVLTSKVEVHVLIMQ